MQIYVQQLSAYIADKSSVQPREKRGHCDGWALRPPPLGGVQPLGGCVVKEGHPSVSQTFHANTHAHTHTRTHTSPHAGRHSAHTHLCTRTRQWCQDHGEVQPSSIPSTSLDSGRRRHHTHQRAPQRSCLCMRHRLRR